MRIKVLGSVSPYPTQKCNGVGYLLSDGLDNLLLDCGTGVVREMNFPQDLENLTVVISHLHKDHYVDLSAIAYASYAYHNLGLLDEKITVYLPKDETIEDYHYLMNYGNENFINFVPYEEDAELQIGDFTATFCQTLHPVKTFAMSVINGGRKVSYSADMGFEERMVEFFNNSDCLICESSYLKDQKSGNVHLSAEEAGKLARMSNAKKLILTHFWPELDKNKYIDEAKMVFDNTEAAVEGSVYEL